VQLLDKNRVVPVRVKILESDALFDRESVIEDLGPTRAHQILEDYLMNHPTRNKMILDTVAKLPGKTIVLSKRVAPCFELSKIMKEEFNIDLDFEAFPYFKCSTVFKMNLSGHLS
jgi:ABC-type antimicrobial peptide transport system permease subunit